MGIKQLMQLLTDKAPESITNVTLESLSGRVLACDASIAIYQFLISTQSLVRSSLSAGTATAIKQLTDPQGNPTS
jgi:flap endonuclease-1